jgi:hypothetical protein
VDRLCGALLMLVCTVGFNVVVGFILGFRGLMVRRGVLCLIMFMFCFVMMVASTLGTRGT